VLEAKGEDGNHRSDSASDDNDDSGGTRREEDIIGKLMGRRRTDGAPGVQEVDDEAHKSCN
jgi:hypothetical protein